ncbi:EcsC family protein [Pedobacter gandavensis]|uniref:EcsC family protein n=1 Tax=Pedobacter TaxID=84567 RepID=UPI001C999CFD|nr:MULTISPECIES: EcsC family protein [Pedobacter]WGQ10458.1 EcsC family protein [Pedobacter gandavensis]
MNLPSIKRINFKKVKKDVGKGLSNLATGGFKQIFSRIDQLNIKKGVDTLGIDKFINQCAYLAAGSGLITGVGGISTMLIGTPVDMINIITQQFRVTLAISYHHTGKSKISFEDFFKIVASSVKADTKLVLSKNIMEEVAEKIFMSLGSKVSRRLIPVVGGVIGGTINYLFIKNVAKELMEKHA